MTGMSDDECIMGIYIGPHLSSALGPSSLEAVVASSRVQTQIHRHALSLFEIEVREEPCFPIIRERMSMSGGYLNIEP